jgi:flavin reductase (DIM6/NTAB) family NADH-FMN oxidoreductase RutF
MRKVKVMPADYVIETYAMLDRGGLLLSTSGKGGKPNVMTIGWGLVGILWYKPTFAVLVRPTRYTYRLLEKSNEFTVNVPSRGMEKIIEYCGNVSGRGHDKFREMGLTPLPGRRVKSPMISECVIHYECNVVYKTKIQIGRLPKEIVSKYYPSKDYHTLYIGEILSTFADEDAKQKLDPICQ